MQVASVKEAAVPGTEAVAETEDDLGVFVCSLVLGLLVLYFHAG